jgi:hypothetical protein
VLESGGIVPVRIAHSGPRWRANWSYPFEERCAQAIEEGRRAQGEQPLDEALDLFPGTGSTSNPARCASSRNSGSPSVAWNPERRTLIWSARPGPPCTAAPLARGSGTSSATARAWLFAPASGWRCADEWDPGVPDSPRVSDHRRSERPRWRGRPAAAIAVRRVGGTRALVGAYPPATPCVFT